MSILSDELALPAYSGLSDEECLNLLQDKTIAVKQNISTSDIKKYLAVMGKLMPLEASASASAKEAVRILELFETFDFTESAVADKLTSMLDALIVDGLIDEMDKGYVLSLGERLISRAEELNIKVKLDYITKTRG